LVTCGDLIAARHGSVASSFSDWDPVKYKVWMKLRSRYRELAVPVEVIAGDRDRVVTTSRQSDRLHAEVPASVIQNVKDAGHMVHHVAPNLVLSAIFSAALAPETGSPDSSSRLRYCH
jgi:pimeloyl-ACP methyl ester carboxylesterase